MSTLLAFGVDLFYANVSAACLSLRRCRVSPASPASHGPRAASRFCSSAQALRRKSSMGFDQVSPCTVHRTTVPLPPCDDELCARLHRTRKCALCSMCLLLRQVRGLLPPPRAPAASSARGLTPSVFARPPRRRRQTLGIKRSVALPVTRRPAPRTIRLPHCGMIRTGHYTCP